MNAQVQIDAQVHKLESRRSLTRAIVVPETQDPNRLREIIGAEVGAYMSRDMTLGLGRGTTLTSGVPAIEPRAAEGVKVLSMLGGLTRVRAINPSEFAWRVADRLVDECCMLAAPVYAPDARTRKVLMGHPALAEVFTRAQSLDMAVFPLGDPTPHPVFSECGLLPRDEIASLEAAGAVGDLLCHFIGAGGNVIDHPVNKRVLAVDPLSVRGNRQIVSTSDGWHKLTVIRAVSNPLLPTVLIFSEVVAERPAAEPRQAASWS